ncbi:hypothetical protein KEM55_008134 [Ascosphaera atra]|nr:hypothetical protein KEM55_008134 [Ascosphaera atra]
MGSGIAGPLAMQDVHQGHFSDDTYGLALRKAMGDRSVVACNHVGAIPVQNGCIEGDALVLRGEEVVPIGLHPAWALTMKPKGNGHVLSRGNNDGRLCPNRVRGTRVRFLDRVKGRRSPLMAAKDTRLVVEVNNNSPGHHVIHAQQESNWQAGYDEGSSSNTARDTAVAQFGRDKQFECNLLLSYQFAANATDRSRSYRLSRCFGGVVLDEAFIHKGAVTP